MRVKVVGGSVCVFGERGRVYREIEREREKHREMESVCREREGVCFEIEEVCREIESACKRERERERERDGKCVQKEGRSVF